MKKKSARKSAFFNPRALISFIFCLAAVFMALVGAGIYPNLSKAQAQPASGSAPGAPAVVRMVGPVRLDQDLRTLPYIPPKAEHEERRLTRHPFPLAGAHGPAGSATASTFTPFNSLIKRFVPNMPPPFQTFEGQGNTCGCQPSDSEGDVGPNHYVEAINESIRIFDKNGNTLSGPTSYNSFFSGLTGNPCSFANDGDPYVIYDQMADRWLISDFAFPSFPGTSFWQCIGISQTSNPVTGGWYLYAVQVDPGNPTYLGDYPKFALWPVGGAPPQNAYFLTMNLFSNNTTFNGVRVYALDRNSMLAGGPTNAIGFTLSANDVGLSYSFVAASYRTGDPPPAGTNEMVLAVDSPNSGGVTLTQVHARFFHVDFANPSNSVFGVGPTHQPNAEITVNGFVDAFTNTTSDLVPQMGTSTKLDTLGDKIMTPVVYQRRGGTESLWADQTVMENYPNGPTAVRWYQFDVTGNVFPATPVQQQTWDNTADGLWRWMPSIAVDQAGNTAIGYSTSATTIFPSIRYAGRLAGDPSGNLAQGEAVMFPGPGFHTGVRWGDYTRTEVDSSNGQAFWHINQYAPSGTWHTRIGDFSFAPLTQSAFSRKVHGSAGTFDIPLPPVGNVGVECRTGPTYQLIVNFVSSVTVGSVTVTSGTGNVDSFSGSGTQQITINLSGVTDAQKITVTMHNVSDGTRTGDVPVTMGVLVGDTTGNGSVNAGDVAQAKSQVGQSVGSGNFREDVNAGGTITATDVAIVKSEAGTSLPP
jgi:hypothetical protein